MSKSITVTVEQLVAFAAAVERDTDYDGCLQSTAEDLVAEFFGVEVPAKPPAPPSAPTIRRGTFTDKEEEAFTKLLDGFTDEMALSRLTKR